MWKAPNRPSGQISQTYNDGYVQVYGVENVAEPGRKPVLKGVFKAQLNYEEQRLGIQRYYAGKQNQAQVEKVIRTQRAGNVTSQDIVVTETGTKYRVDLVQVVMDVFPPSQDITLVAYGQQEVEV